MDTYVILRRHGWRTPEELEEAAERSAEAGATMPDEVKWIRTYALVEDDGGLGTVCIYQATDPDALRRHAAKAGLPADELLKVADVMIVNEDPVPATG